MFKNVKNKISKVILPAMVLCTLAPCFSTHAGVNVSGRSNKTAPSGNAASISANLKTAHAINKFNQQSPCAKASNFAEASMDTSEDRSLLIADLSSVALAQGDC